LRALALLSAAAFLVGVTLASCNRTEQQQMATPSDGAGDDGHSGSGKYFPATKFAPVPEPAATVPIDAGSKQPERAYFPATKAAMVPHFAQQRPNPQQSAQATQAAQPSPTQASPRQQAESTP
jgi:hypothetical protein